MLNSADVAGVISAIAGGLGTLGFGVKYIIGRIDAREEALQVAEDKAREELKTFMQAQIDGLTKAHIQMESRMEVLTEANHTLNRHVGILIGILQSNNLAVPAEVLQWRGDALDSPEARS